MKIDFHCHTLSTKSHEETKRNVTDDLFKEKVLSTGVECLAITNHNHFDREQYLRLRELVAESTLVWPGIELDVKGKVSSGHIIVIGNPDNISQFTSFVAKLAIDSADDYELDSDQLAVLFNKNDFFMIGHFVKHKSLELKDLIHLNSKIDQKTRFLKEPGSLTSIGVLHSYDHRVLIGSDVQDWDKYQECNFGDLKFPIDTYSNFLKLLDKNDVLINDMIKQRHVEDIVVYGEAENKNYEYQMPVYNDVNVIFGDKGSGKSEILKSLYRYYEVEKGIKPVFFEGGSKDEWFSKKLITDDAEYDASLYKISDKKGYEFSQILNYSESNPKPVLAFVNYYKYMSKNAKRKRMLILNIEKEHTFETKMLDIYKKEYEIVKTFGEEQKQFTINRRLKSNEEFIKKFEIYKNEMYETLLKEFVNQFSIYFHDKTIEKLNDYVSESTGTAPMPTETGFAEFAKGRFSLYNNVLNFVNVLKTDIKIERKYIGDVGEKGKGYIIPTVCFANSLNVKTLNYKKMKSKKGDIQKILNGFDIILERSLSSSIMDEVAKIGEICKNSCSNNLDDFLYVSKDFFLEDAKYTPSKGEKAILALQYELLSRDSGEIYLVDEPELSLGSLYIENNIVPLIRDLSKRRKVVVIATHDANIAVRTRPVSTVLKTVDNNVYRTYIGSMFTNRLTDISDPLKSKDWREESIKHLEGGEDAFEERGYLYEQN